MVRTAQLDRYTPAGFLARHPLILLPPNVVAQWASAQVAAGLTATTFATFPTRTAFGTSGGIPGNVTVNFTTATGFVNTMRLEIEVSGLDENWEPCREIISCVGNAAATQAIGGSQLFSQVDTIRYQSSGSVAFSGSGASVTIGTGDGVANTATMLIQNVLPFISVSAISILPTGVNAGAAASYINVPSGALPDGKGGFRAWKVTTNYGTSNTVRPALVIMTNQQASSVEL